MDSLFTGAKDDSFSRGDEISINGSVFEIRDGYVGLYGQSGSVKRLLFVYKKGDIFPTANKEEDLLQRDYVYIAMKRLRVRSLPQAAFDAKLGDPQYAKKVLRYYRSISSLQFERINNMQQIQVFARLVERLLFFAQRLGIEEKNKVKIDVPLSHVDIATSIGATRETVNRYMRQLEKKGLITVTRQRITIDSIPKLQQLLVDKDPLSRPKFMLAGVTLASSLGMYTVL